MTIYVKDSGNWETVTDVYVRRAGSWTPLTQTWVKKYQVDVDVFGRFNWQNVFFTTGNAPFTSAFSANQFYIQTSDFYNPVKYPSGVSGSVVTPYGCNRCYISIVGQGGSGAATTTNTAGGAGGGGAAIRTPLVGFAVTEFVDVFNWSIGNENGITTSGDGTDGATVSVSWTGNVLTAEGGKAGLAAGTNGAGGAPSGSGLVLASSTTTSGLSGSTNAWGFNAGGDQPASYLPFARGGVLYYQDPNDIAAWQYPIQGGGGGGGFNSYGQKGGDAFISINFWRV